MLSYRTIALPEALSEEVRTRRLSPGYGHPVHEETAMSYGPCRSCLQFFREGEEQRLLFTHDAFGGLEKLPLPGPVFIHAEKCPRHREDQGLPAHLRTLDLTLNAYGEGRRRIAQEYATGEAVEKALDRLLGLPDLAYILVRNTAAGCYIARIKPSFDRPEEAAS